MSDTHDKHPHDPKDPDDHFAPDFHHRNVPDRIKALEDMVAMLSENIARQHMVVYELNSHESLFSDLQKRVTTLEAKVTALHEETKWLSRRQK